jgi:tetratricopeptide (TPR) repeat protein
MHHNEILMSRYEDLRKEFLQARNTLERIPTVGAYFDFLKGHIYDLQEEMGWILFDLGEYEKGLALYKSLPSGESKFNGMIRAYIEMEYYDEARKLIEKGLRRYPESYGLWIARGVLNQRLGYDLESLKCFQFAQKYAPADRSEAFFDIASSLFDLGYHVEALKICKRLVKKDPDEPMYLMALGSCLLKMKYPKEALKYYKRAYDTGKLSIGIFEGLYHSYASMGLKKEALEIALQGLREFTSEDPHMYAIAADAYHKLGWRDEANSILNEGLKKFPRDQELKEMLDEIDDGSDDPDRDKSTLLGLLLLKAYLNKKHGKRS